MAKTVTIKAGVLNDDNNLLYQVPSVMPPFLSGHGVYARQFKMGAASTDDYASGDDMILTFPASDTILFAIAVTDGGVIKGYTEAAIATGEMGRQLTFAAISTVLKVYIVFSI